MQPQPSNLAHNTLPSSLAPHPISPSSHPPPYSPCFQLVELLLRYGANPSQQNSKGEAPEDIECSQVIKDLLKSPPIGIDGMTAFASSVSSGASSVDEDEYLDSKG